MLGQMMHRPLSIIEILRFAAETHPKAEIVSVRTEGDVHRYYYPDAYLRVGQLANVLKKLVLVLEFKAVTRSVENELTRPVA